MRFEFRLSCGWVEWDEAEVEWLRMGGKTVEGGGEGGFWIRGGDAFPLSYHIEWLMERRLTERL